jgi:integrase
MSAKNSITTSHHINYDEALNTGKKLLSKESSASFGFYIIVAINTGLRIGDILTLTKTDFDNGYKDFREQKTNKVKRLDFNAKILEAYKSVKPIGELVFTSTHQSTFSPQQINRKLKQVFKYKRKNISSHSLRKSFGRKVYEDYGETDSILNKLSTVFNHSSTKITRTYLDITQEEIADIYMNL